MKNIKSILYPFAALLMLWSIPVFGLGVGSKFNYNGRLQDSQSGSGPGGASGRYDFCFTLYPAPTGASPTGSAFTNSSVAVSNGLFATQVDFGTNVFDGTAYWMEVGVRTNGTNNAFTMLSPRQEVTATPYASYAPSAGTAATADGVASNAVTGESIQDAAITESKLAAGAVVKTLNGLKDHVTLAAGSNVTLNPVGNIIEISATIDLDGAIRAGPSAGFAFMPASFAVGDSPYSVAAADVNGDGRIDLISANIGANTLSVLTNNGSGNFALATSPSVGLQPGSVAAADVNGDGRADLISANSGFGANTLSVLTNNGSGNFALAATLAVSNRPESVAAADVNGDGSTDLISTGFGSHTLSVLTNSGGGAFTLAASPNAGTNTSSVVAADVNGDGRTDLITANGNANSLSVLTNNGTGGFVLATSPNFGTAPSSVVVADVNSDGRRDLISALVDANAVAVLTNNGSGSFIYLESVSVGIAPYSVAAADVNGDGRVDVISANLTSGTLSVLTNRGSGRFSLAVSPGVGNSPLSVATADVNGDGRVDLVSADSGANTLSVLQNVPLFIFAGRFSGDGSALNLLDSNGRLGIGRAAANNRLEVEGQASKTTSGSWLANSDARIKHEVRTVGNALRTLEQVRLVSFRYTDTYRAQHPFIDDRQYLNVIAQEFQKVFPEHVKSSGEKLPNGEEILQVDTHPLTIYSAAAVQELNKVVKDKDAEIQELKKSVVELKELVGKMAGQQNGGVK